MDMLQNQFRFLMQSKIISPMYIQIDSFSGDGFFQEYLQNHSSADLKRLTHIISSSEGNIQSIPYQQSASCQFQSWEG